ncbi:hypothetical protein JW979_11025, partial [bacterium]|nr:hypothetical protein [candidate division CSSED10-310 bacterium]
INAGPGVFMHLVPAEGESIDVPDKIITAFFPNSEYARVPTLVFNKLPSKVTDRILKFCEKDSRVEEVGLATARGVYFNGNFFSNRPEHTANIRNVMRNPKLDMALIEYSDSIVQNEGLYHWGADLVVLDQPTDAEKILERDLLPNGVKIEVDRVNKEVLIHKNGTVQKNAFTANTLPTAIYKAIEPELKRLIEKYHTPFN